MNKPTVALPEALRQFQRNNDSGIVFGYDVAMVDAAIAAYQCVADVELGVKAGLREEVVAKDRRIAELEAALTAFIRAAYPVAPEINQRGYNWSDAYLDEALNLSKQLLPQHGKEGEA